MGVLKNLRNVLPLPRNWKDDEHHFGLRVNDAITELFAKDDKLDKKDGEIDQKIEDLTGDVAIRVKQIVLDNGDTTWAKIWTKINELEVSKDETASIVIYGNAMPAFSDNKLTQWGFGLIERYSSTRFDITLYYGTREMYACNITNATSSGRTFTYEKIVRQKDIPYEAVSLKSHANVRNIPSYSDLDNLREPGSYSCSNSDVASTLTHLPNNFTYGNFRLYTLVNTGDETGSGSWWGMQIILTGRNNLEKTRIYIRGHDDTTYSSWSRVDNYDDMDLLSSITWNNFTKGSDSFFHRSGRTCNLCVTSSGNVTLTNNTLIGTIGGSYTRPWGYIVCPIFEYTSGKIIANAGIWIYGDGSIRYFGNTINSTKIIFSITYLC